MNQLEPAFSLFSPENAAVHCWSAVPRKDPAECGVLTRNPLENPEALTDILGSAKVRSFLCSCVCLVGAQVRF